VSLGLVSAGTLRTPMILSPAISDAGWPISGLQEARDKKVKIANRRIKT
jgi:hypothetical protein